ncbi:MAG: KH domain-containing protein [Candidatus Bathyarchaeota archaeon]|nr:KH domain-containing protein [Candidatus Bathyarchaeota archaeon]
MEQKTYIKIPQDRVGVLIGPHGQSKKRIEATLLVDLTVDGESGNVEVKVLPEQTDVSVIFTAKNMVKAIGRGFSPQRAMALMNEDNDLLVIDLEDYVGTSKNAQARIKGRLIGKEGKSRELIEELTECLVSIYGGTVALIGSFEMLPVAKEAVEMLINGAFHKTVWNHLYAYRRRLKKEKGELWYEPKRRRE